MSSQNSDLHGSEGKAMRRNIAVHALSVILRSDPVVRRAEIRHELLSCSLPRRHPCMNYPTTFELVTQAASSPAPSLHSSLADTSLAVVGTSRSSSFVRLHRSPARNGPIAPAPTAHCGSPRSASTPATAVRLHVVCCGASFCFASLARCQVSCGTRFGWQLVRLGASAREATTAMLGGSPRHRSAADA